MKRNKMMACILALVLLMAAAPPLTASAAGSAALTVIPPPSLILTAGDFKAYKLFDVAVSGTAPDKNYAYTATAATDAFLSSTGPSFPFGSTSAAFMAYLENDPDMDDLNIALTAYAGDPGFHADFKKSAAQEPAPDEARVKFSGLDYGYYLIIGEGGATDSAGEATGERVVAYSALHTVEQANETIHLKADAPLIDKKIWNHNAGVSPLNPEDAGWMDWTDVNIGGGVDFKLRSRVPVMTGYKDYAFTVHDYMSRGLTFQSGSVKVTVGGEELAEDVDYEVSAASSIPNGDPRDNTGEEYKGGSYITIAFDPVRFIDLTPGAAIVITYSARLNTAAVIGAPGNPNKVWLQYSNDPYTTGDGDGGSTGETPEDEVRAYTFDLDILKYDGNGEDAENFNPVAFPLPDAEFELSHVISLTEKPLVELVALEEDGRGNYRLAVPSDASADIVTTLVSDANGKIYIKGLDAGVYELEETKAPVGYHPGFITEITITHNGEGGYDVVVDEAAVNRVDIANYSGGLLPDTGGIGKIIFYAVSAALTAGLIVLAAIYVFLRKRKNRFSAG